MIESILRIVALIALLGCITSCFYFLFCIWNAIVFMRQARAGSASARAAKDFPPVSVLKPLKGPDPEIYESFRSHCMQDYPKYELIFGVSDPADPAVKMVERLQAEFPSHAIHLLICRERLGPNVKVSNLEQMTRIARYDHLIVNDSDIRVEPDYIHRVVSPLTGQRVGLVTCLYRGVAARTLGSRLESLGISTDFCPGVLVARQLQGGLNFGLGSTLSFRRSELEQIGGFRSIVDSLADDYELGHRISDLGRLVQLSEVVVETHLPAYDFAGFLAHQLRWARGVRDARFGGYLGLIFTFGLLWAAIAVTIAHAALWAWGVFFLVVGLRFAAAIAVGKGVLRDNQLIPNLWLLPVRDLIAVAVWITSFAGHTVTWRGDSFLLKRGKLVPRVSHTEMSETTRTRKD